MIKINDLEIRKEENCLTLHFNYTGDSDRVIKIFAFDLIFETVDVWYKMIARPGVNHWVSLNFSIHRGNYLDTGLKFQFLNANDGEEEYIIHKECIHFINTDTSRRSLNGSYSKNEKNFWVIGDSNTGFLFKDIENDNLYQNGYVINHVTHLLLSLNRFLKSDYLSYMKSLPIRDNDTISFFLGEIDLRVSILRNASLKGENPKDVLDKILESYKEALYKIKERYPNCDIVVLRTNPPIKDGVINDSKLIFGTEKERLYLHSHFDNFFRYQTDFKYWDCLSDYSDESGYLKNEFIVSDTNQHLNNGNLFLEQLKNKII